VHQIQRRAEHPRERHRCLQRLLRRIGEIRRDEDPFERRQVHRGKVVTDRLGQTSAAALDLRAGRWQEDPMSSQVIAARIRGFICLNAHPTGCAANVDAEIAVAQKDAPGKGLGGALVIGGSTGYGLSSLVSAVFGYGARGTVVCLERPPHGEKTASAGWYNLAAAQQRARGAGREIAVVNGDAFSREIKEQTIAGLQKAGGKLDQVIYSVAAPKRVDGDTS